MTNFPTGTSHRDSAQSEKSGTMAYSLRARIVHGFGASGSFQLANIVLQLLLLPVLASHWGANLYGAWVMLFTLPSFLSLSDLGFGSTSATQMTMRVAQGQFAEAAVIFQSAWLTMLCLSSVLCLSAGVIGALLPAGAFPSTDAASADELRYALWLLIGYSWIGLQGWMIIGVLRANGDFAIGTFTMAIVVLVEGGVIATSVALGGSIVLASGLYLLLRSFGVFALILQAKRRASWLELGFEKVNLEEIRRLCAPSVASMVIPMSLAGVLQGTALVVGIGAGPLHVAAFTAIRTLTRSGVQIGSLVCNAIAPEVSASYARNERGRLVKLYGLTLAYSAAVLGPAFFFLYFFGERFIELWSRGTIQVSHSVILVMTLVMLLHGLWYPVSNLLQAINHQRYYAYRYLLLSIISVFLAYPLADRFGALGGAISMLLLESAMFVVISRLANKVLARPAEVRGLIFRLFITTPNDGRG